MVKSCIPQSTWMHMFRVSTWRRLCLRRACRWAKSPNGVEMERPDRGLLADQDHQRAIWTSRARRFTSMAMVVDFLTAILALVAGGIINRWGLTASRLHPGSSQAAWVQAPWVGRHGRVAQWC